MSDRTLLFIAEPASVTGFFSTLKEAGLEAGLADNLNGAINFIKKSKPLLVFTRPNIQLYKAEDLFSAAQSMDGFPPVIVFSRSGSADDARKYLEMGARDYWVEPLLWEKIKLMLPSGPAVAELDDEDVPDPAPAKPDKPQTARAKRFEIIGDNPSVRRVLSLAKQVAGSKATVLISGESGTGKEMFARFLHFESDRADKPFVAINCAALPEHLLESELFGHEKGSFTGAISRKLGKFEMASGGTILLDEITEMDIGLQAKLLRVLQEGEFDRVGGTETIGVDVRVLATTNRDIAEAVEKGNFRQDLYYRLNVIPLMLPALKDRGEDVMLLADYFVTKFCKAYGLAKLAFSGEARKWLTEYEWPGNVRELQNLMERAVLLAGNGPIDSKHFLLDPEAWTPDEEDTQAPSPTPVDSDEFLSVMPLHEMEKRLILKSLDETSGNRTQAAELLGISVRTLRNKLNEYRKGGTDIP